MEFVIVTGISGAGKSGVMKSLEDIGFFCIDNLPVKLIPTFAQLLENSEKYRRVAVATDVRAGFSFEDFCESTKSLDEYGIEFKILFIDAKDEVLIRRYKETRRRHPLLSSGNLSIAQAIQKERQILSAVREEADYLLDTSNLSAIQCRVRIIAMFSENKQSDIHIHCMSFGFKHGIPNDADFIFDVRFLPNPFYVPELKEHTGLEKSVSDYVMSFAESKEYKKKLIDFLKFAIPLCKQEGRTQLIIGIGCTGGHHRSVTFANLLYNYLVSKDYSASVSHRDILK